MEMSKEMKLILVYRAELLMQKKEPYRNKNLK